ncbi:sensor histidine kinase [Luteibacter sp. CQ10]|uniref:sensor histidine kinase n=1 Tax=Luteibacter sp. CQ10 TaxID=2805821 RepID=UPI0034A23B7F
MARSWFEPTPDSLWVRFGEKPRQRAANLFHLIWTIYFFIDLLGREALPPRWTEVTLLAFPTFLFLYACVLTRPVRQAPWFGAAMAVLGMDCIWADHGGGSCFIVYACSFVGLNASFSVAYLRMAIVLAAYWGVVEWTNDWPWQEMAFLSLISVSVGTVNLFYRASAKHDAELKLSHDEVRRLAATAERERIGRDLHDLLGHTLSLITLKLELSRRLIDRDVDAARREMEEAEGVARHALAEVRSAVTGIRATGLAAELASARLMLNASMVNFDYVTDVPALPERMEAGLALVLREAVTNIHRHAQATVAEAKVAVEKDVLTLCIVDNGRGGVDTEGNGLCGMRERVKALGGTLRIESERGKGTRLQVAVPLLAAERIARASAIEADRIAS